MAQSKPRMGPKGPKRSAGGAKGTNKTARAPKHSSGSHGGKKHGRLT